MDSQSTQDLVRTAKAGCKRSFEVLVQRYGPRLESLIHLRLGPRLRTRIAPEDIYQETLLRAFESISRFEYQHTGSFFQWLGGIAEHVIQNQARKNSPDRVQFLPFGAGNSSSAVKANGDQLAADEPPPNKPLEWEERFQRLRNALESLSEDHREVIILARVRGLPIQEIAQKMGRSPDAISMLLLRAVRHLRLLFGSTESFHLPARSLDSPALWGGPLPPACGKNGERDPGGRPGAPVEKPAKAVAPRAAPLKGMGRGGEQGAGPVE